MKRFLIQAVYATNAVAFVVFAADRLEAYAKARSVARRAMQINVRSA